MRAFSLVELMIVMVMVVVVLAATYPVTSRFQIDTKFNEAGTLIAQDLALAAADSQAGWLDSSYGLKFLDDTYVVYRGANYAARLESADRVVALPRGLVIDLTQSLGGGEISFNHQGLPREFGKVKMCQGAECRELSINNRGLIKQENE